MGFKFYPQLDLLPRENWVCSSYSVTMSCSHDWGFLSACQGWLDLCVCMHVWLVAGQHAVMFMKDESSWTPTDRSTVVFKHRLSFALFILLSLSTITAASQLTQSLFIYHSTCLFSFPLIFVVEWKPQTDSITSFLACSACNGINPWFPIMSSTLLVSCNPARKTYIMVNDFRKDNSLNKAGFYNCLCINDIFEL